jgi:hypothetical protein
MVFAGSTRAHVGVVLPCDDEGMGRRETILKYQEKEGKQKGLVTTAFAPNTGA